jgi:hypothetical protein
MGAAPHDLDEGFYQPSIRGATRGDVAKIFYDVAKDCIQCCEPSSVQHPTTDVCIDVAGLFVVCCEQHASNIQCFG